MDFNWLGVVFVSDDLPCEIEEMVEQKKEIAEEYKEIIPQNVYEALLNYKVRIENDKNITR